MSVCCQCNVAICCLLSRPTAWHRTLARNYARPGLPPGRARHRPKTLVSITEVYPWPDPWPGPVFARRPARQLELTQDLSRATLCVKTHNILQVLETRYSKTATILAHPSTNIHFVTPYLARHALTKPLVSARKPSSKLPWALRKAFLFPPLLATG